MTCNKGVVFFAAAEQGQPLVPGDAVTGFRFVQVGGEVFELQLFGFFGKGCAHGHEVGSVFHVHHVFRIHLQGLDKTFFQLRQEIEGPA